MGVGVVLLVISGSVAGLWWQSTRAAATARNMLLSAAETELGRDPLDRGGLVQADRDLAALATSDMDGGLRRCRAKIALALRLPDQALRAIDEAGYVSSPEPEDPWLRAQALAMRHAIGGRIDDAARASRLALEYFDMSYFAPAALLAWQCATRVADEAQADVVAARLLAQTPDAFETKVVQALRGFDPAQPELVARVQALQQEGGYVLELEAAVALVDTLSSDEAARVRGMASIQQVLEKVPSSKPARVVAVLACDRAGDNVGRAAHLQWLLTNFPQDPGAEKWRELLLAK